MGRKRINRTFLSLVLTLLLVLNLVPLTLYGAQEPAYGINIGQDWDEASSLDDSSLNETEETAQDTADSDEADLEDAGFTADLTETPETVPQENTEPVVQMFIDAFSAETVSVTGDLVLTVDSLEEALTAINSDGGSSYEILLPAAGSETLSAPLSTVKNVTISSDEEHPYVIYAPSGGKHLTVNGSLSLENVVFDGGEEGGGIEISNNAVLNLYDGGVIQKADGFGIHLLGANSILNMYGGLIGDNLNSGVYLTNGTFNFTGGTISGNTATNGAGIYATNGTVNLDGGIVSGNTAENQGGGIYQFQGLITMSNGAVTGNQAKYGSGAYIRTKLILDGGEFSYNTAENDGCIYVLVGAEVILNGGTVANNTSSRGGGIYVSSGNFTLNGGEISENKATTYGGGIYTQSGRITIDGGKITKNTALNGAGINGFGTASTTVTIKSGEISYNIAEHANAGIDFSDGTLNLSGGTINDNICILGNGGGIGLRSGVTFNMSGGEILNNTAKNSGGGIYVNGAKSGVITGGTVSGNKSGSYGAGIAIFMNTLTISNLTLTDNKSETYGGGICIGEYVTSCVINSATISGNHADWDGGGLYSELPSYGNFTVENPVVFSNNTAGSFSYPPDNALTAYPNIKTSSSSGSFGHPLNNYDINYLSYSVTYDVNGGNNDGPLPAKSLTPQIEHVLDNSTKPTHANDSGEKVLFVGWTAERIPEILYGSDDAPDRLEKVAVTGSVVVYAAWGYDLDDNGIPDVLEGKRHCPTTPTAAMPTDLGMKLSACS